MLSESKTFVICEISQTHEGSLSLAKMLVKAAAKAKSDAVKIQIFRADELSVPSYKYYGLFKQLEWPEDKWKELIDFTHECGLKFLADVFGVDSVNMLTKLNIDGFKVHGTDMRNICLLKKLSNVDRPLLLSIGGANLREVKDALSLLNAGNRKFPIILMHGFQSYPTLVEHTNLEKMRYFKDQLKMTVGFADHIAGDHRLNFALCAAAIGMGASVIEKHITISRALKMEDYESALNPEEFMEFVSKIHEVDAAKGQYNDHLISVEEDYRRATRKHVVTNASLKKGQEVKEEDVTLKRVESSSEPSDLEDIIGKKTNKDYAVNEALLRENLA